MKKIISSEKIQLDKMNRWWTSGILMFFVLLFLSIVGFNNILDKILPQKESLSDGLALSQINESSMSSLDLAHSLALAIRSDRNLEAVYQSISKSQAEDLDATYFYQYIQALKGGVFGPITNIVPLKESEKDKILDLLAAGKAESRKLAQNSDFYYLSYDKNNRSSRFAIAIQKKESGQAYLDNAWIKDIIAMDNYIRLYFASINENNLSALHSLLKTAVLPANEIEEEVLSARCKTILDYYSQVFNIQREQYELNSLYPGFAEIGQYGALSSSPLQKISRTVRFQMQDNHLTINDPITETLLMEDLNLYHSGEKLLAFDDSSNEIRLSSKTFDRLLGSSLSHDDSSCYRTASGEDIFTVEYPGITLTARGSCENRHSNWRGSLIRAEISYSSFNLGSGINPGMHINEAYLRYPFARENNYLLKRQIEDTNFSLAIQVESGYIAKLTLTSDH